MKLCCENIEVDEKLWALSSKENRFLKTNKIFKTIFRKKETDLRPKYIWESKT